MPSVGGGLHLSPKRGTGNQPRDLRPAPSRHLGQIPAQQLFARPPLPVVALFAQEARYPSVDFRPSFALKPDLLAGFQKRLDLLQALLLGVLHVEGQSPASQPPTPFSPYVNRF